MQLKLDGGTAASQEALDALERKLGCPLPLDFIEFVRVEDGARPENNTFKIGNHNQCGVNGFIPVALIHEEMRSLDDLPPHSFPIAWAEGGNYVVIREGSGSGVYFWDHEIADEMSQLAENFSDFLGVLRPFDVSSIELKPGQVTRSWINPDFLKSLRDEPQ